MEPSQFQLLVPGDRVVNKATREEAKVVRARQQDMRVRLETGVERGAPVRVSREKALKYWDLLG